MEPQKHNIFHGKFIKTGNDKLSPVSSSEAKYKEFVKHIEVGQTVEIFLESNKDDGTLAQLAKIHVCLRELGKEIGYTFEEIKLEMLKMSGLCFLTQHQGQTVLFCKNLGDCSKEELSLMIEAIIKAGDTAGIKFR
jgi:hypothetical protein